MTKRNSSVPDAFNYYNMMWATLTTEELMTHDCDVLECNQAVKAELERRTIPIDQVVLGLQAIAADLSDSDLPTPT